MIIYKKIESYLESNNITKKIWIIDKNVFELWSDRILKIINRDKFFILESKEENKTLKSSNNILDFLFENNIDRSYTIFGIGGGIIGDITGFVASTYLRGIKLVHVPTTLLAMVDSSIGGKTGVNNNYGKNMIGTIYQAKDIVIDTSWLTSLPEEQKINGMAEVIKMALIKGGQLYNLVSNSEPSSWKNLDEMIKMSANYKLDIIEDDFRDTNGSRELLNLGHSWGHGYELSQNVLHGYAVADGIIEELKYTHYYYNFPSLSVIKEILDLLTRWTLLKNKNLSFNRFEKNYENKLIYFYLSKDKKENRIVTLEKIGLAKIVTWDLDKLKFINSRYFKIKNNSIKNSYLRNFKVPSSKSITNRSLICAVISSFFSKKEFKLNNILKSEDTELMISALKQSNIKLDEVDNNVIIYPSFIKPNGNYYLGNSGTSVRFLLPILALTTQEEIIIDGSEDMRKRPIGPLVKSLINFGCNIEDKEFLPIKIKPSIINKNIICIDGSLSSQYVTGLLLAFSLLKTINPNNIYIIRIEGDDTSSGFIKMTLDMLDQFGIEFSKDDKVISINKIKNKINYYEVEGDATTASYLFGWSFLNKFTLEIDNLNLKSVQPDMNVLLKMLDYFGNVSERGEKLIFEPFNEVRDSRDNLQIDLDSSDTFLTWACLFYLENKKIEITNIKNQNWKECPRIDKFIENIEKIGGKCDKTETGFKIINTNINSNDISIDTCKDHRLAMSFSLMSMLHSNVHISNPHCVNKTYPKYWEDMKKLNINIIPKDRLKFNTITLIGMPGSGKTVLAKELGEKLGIKYFDIDNLIENDVGPIIDFIDNNSWKLFRDLETKHIFESLMDEDFKVISTGGGAIENFHSRNLLENSIIIWVKRNVDSDTYLKRKLEDSFKNLEIKRKNIYESLSDYIYNNEDTPYDFVKWLRVILFENPIPTNSTFLCKSDTNYEANISNYVEYRADLNKNFDFKDIQDLIIKFGKPCIFTLRSSNEGGLFEGSDIDYINMNKKAIKHGASIIDVEVSKNITIYNDVKTIGSIHSDNMDYIEQNVNKFNYDILKIVTNNNNCSIIKIKKNIILIDNDNGKYRTRNSFLTPISSYISRSTAVNQLNYLKYLEKCHENYKKKFLFLFGSNIGESPSSFIHNMVIGKYHKDIIYFNFETKNIEDVFNLVKQEYFLGASVTMPFKEDVANKFGNKKMKAINTIIKNDKIICEAKRLKVSIDNTDTKALKYYVKDILTIILGTGGAAIGAIEAIEDKSKIVLFGRDINKLNELAEKYSITTMNLKEFKKINYNYQLINCLPPNVQISQYVDKNCTLIDMTYGIHNYKKKDNCINGYDILHTQAAYQYISWFKVDTNNQEQIFIDYKNAMNCFLDSKFLIL